MLRRPCALQRDVRKARPSFASRQARLLVDACLFALSRRHSTLVNQASRVVDPDCWTPSSRLLTSSRGWSDCSARMTTLPRVFPEDSSHFLHWIFKPSDLDAMRAHVRTEAERRLCERLQESGATTLSTAIKFPTQQETDELVSYFVSQLLFVCAEKRFEYRVAATAAAFLARFYLRRSVLDYDPRRILLTCILLAAKVEESTTTTLRTFCDGLIASRNRLAEILNLELVVLDALSFHLLVLNARAPIHYLTTQYYHERKSDTMLRPEEINVLGDKLADLNRQAEQLALKAYAGCDVAFRFTPAQIAVASFLQVSASVLPDAEKFVHSQCLKSPEKYGLRGGAALSCLQEVRTLLTLILESQQRQTDEERAQKAFKTLKKIEKITKLFPKTSRKDKAKRAKRPAHDERDNSSGVENVEMVDQETATTQEMADIAPHLPSVSFPKPAADDAATHTTYHAASADVETLEPPPSKRVLAGNT